MGITRNLEKQLQEKEEKIKAYEARLAELEANSGAMQKNMENKFQGEIDEMTRKHDNLMNQKEGEMQGLEGELGTLHEFKDTKQIREENLAREMTRFKQLKRQLENLKQEGQDEMEAMKKKIDERNDKELKDFERTAQSNAEKNISEIERNIQAQNQRLDDEAKLQEYELEYM